MNYTTEWVCEDCVLQLSGFDAHEMGRDAATLVEPYSRKTDEDVRDIVVGLAHDATDCEFCNGDYDDETHYEECAVDDTALMSCDSCGRFGGEYHKAHAVTVGRQS